MLNTHFKGLLVLIWVSLSAVFASAQVSVSLISESKTPRAGEAFQVGIVLEHSGHWHTYWLNAGTGYPTTVEWELPEGWTASSLQWPAPELLHDENGSIIGQGYTGTTLLQTTITPAPTWDGSPVSLGAAVDYLMCESSCMPGFDEVELSLTGAQVGGDTPFVDSDWQALAATNLYPSENDEGLRVFLDEGEVVFAWEGQWTEARYFPESELVDYAAEQDLRLVESGTELHVPLQENSGQLSGVLVLGEGTKAFAVDVPLSSLPPVGQSVGEDSVTEGEVSLSLGTLCLALVGGLVLNLMPCVFPVLGLKILGFVEQAGQNRRRVVAHGVSFSLGVLLSFWALGAALAIMRAGGTSVGWGFQLQSPAFVYSLVILLLAVGLNLSGVFEFGMGATSVGGKLHGKSGLSGSFFSGILATVVATPCSAPFLAPALGAALAVPVVDSFLIFTAIAIGLAAPYLLLSLFPDATRFLPRPGAWMETFKQAMAFPMYATAGLLLWVFAGQVESDQLLFALIALPLFAAALWIFGKFCGPIATQRSKAWGWSTALLCLAVGTLAGYPQSGDGKKIEWEPWSKERLASLQAEGRPVYVDFTARWCFTCQTNKAAVFSSSEVLEYLERNDVALLKGDWTNRDPEITAELQRWGRSAVPFNLVYLPGEAEPSILPEVLTSDRVLRAFCQADATTGS